MPSCPPVQERAPAVGGSCCIRGYAVEPRLGVGHRCWRDGAPPLFPFPLLFVSSSSSSWPSGAAAQPWVFPPADARPWPLCRQRGELRPPPASPHASSSSCTLLALSFTAPSSWICSEAGGAEQGVEEERTQETMAVNWEGRANTALT